MGSLFSFFRSAPSKEMVVDQAAVKKRYGYWRIRIFYSMFIGYALYYFTRLSGVFAIPGLKESMGLSISQLGLFGSVMSITYGLSKFVSGMVSDRCNPRYFMSFGLIMTGLFNIFFGLSSSFMLFLALWGLNGWFQGFGWPPCAKYLTHWYSHSERGSWWSSWNVSHNLGAFIIPWIVGYCLQYYGWRWAMYIPGIVAIFGGLFLLERLRDTPESMGLPPVEEYRNDSVGQGRVQESQGESISTWQMLKKYVFGNKYIWCLAFASFFLYIVRTAIGSWTVLYLLEKKAYTKMGASGCVSFFELGGFLGSLMAGWASDKLFSANRGPVNILYAVGLTFSCALFWMVPVGHPWMDMLSIFAVGFMLFGPQMLMGIHAAELCHKKGAATSTGFIGYFAYLGAAFAGYPLGLVMQNFGWQGFFASIFGCCLVTLGFLVPLWGVVQYDEKPKVQLA